MRMVWLVVATLAASCKDGELPDDVLNCKRPAGSADGIDETCDRACVDPGPALSAPDSTCKVHFKTKTGVPSHDYDGPCQTAEVTWDSMRGCCLDVDNAAFAYCE